MSIEEQNESNELSAIEYALLEMTNDIEEYGKRTPTSIILTSKDTYTWATAIVLLLEADEQLDEQRFIEALRYVYDQNETEIKRYFSKANSFRPPFDEEIFETIIAHLSNYLNIQIDAKRAADRAQQAYKSLLDKGLIEDPVDILISGIQFAVLGLLPVGFTMITEKGRITKLRYRSILLDIDYNKTSVKRTISINIRLQKFLGTFKGALIDVLKRTLSDQEDKQENIKSQKRPRKKK